MAVAVGLSATTAASATAAVPAPPGRAYEMVSPADKAGSDVSWGSMQATASGDKIAYGVTAAYAGAPTSLLGGIDVAQRGDDWTTKSLDAPQGSAAGLLISSVAFNSPDLGTSLVESSAALAPGATEGDGNVYVRDNARGAYSFVGSSSNPLFNQLFLFLGSPVAGTSADMKHIVFDVNQGVLSPDAIDGSPNAYEYVDGRLRLVGVLPDGTVNPTGARTKPAVAHDAHVVSDDGRRVYFTIDSFGEAPLYLREDGTRTIPISASRVPGDEGTMYPATFGGATADGDVAYFSSMNPLTPESTTSFSATLYRYQRSTDTLTDLTPDVPSPGAGVNAILQVSADGHYVWFTATGVLASGATEGDANLYVWHDGTIRFESTLGPLETYGPTTWNMSPDGHLLAFSTDGPAPGYDNASAACPMSVAGACAEVQLADASTSAPARCISCPSDGATARGDARIADTTSTLGNYWPRSVLDDGRVFFNSPERLVPEDTNGKLDVYMWSGDHASLISTGRSEDDSTFGDASADGRDVFFRTTERLVARDTDRNIDLYDARLGGGIAAQDVTADTRPCAGDACRPRPSDPPAAAQPSSAAFQGPGDPAAPAASTPRFTVKALTRAQKKRLAKTGKVTLSVKVTRPGRVSVTARATVRGHAATVARGSATAARARTVSIALTLSRATRKALAQRKHPVLTLHVAYSPMRETKTIKVTL
ncbi:MAG TPA: hypothetical protein VFG42_27335 [Baekduia sp.]|uniref:hypothetical protein n=1 Tax=Baekduia sp. TaxID=2600305 RepID=UPI002D7717C3|nr:hypothetical protein [Baekduia sp.]HET6510540.1 hypothetical protein [Baekduia sp.]